MPKPGSYFDAEYVEGKGSNHGTPYLFDRTIPLLMRSRGLIAEGAETNEEMPSSRFKEVAWSMFEKHR